MVARSSARDLPSFIAGTSVASGRAMVRRLLPCLALGLVSACYPVGPAPSFQIKEVATQRLPDGRVEAAVTVENTKGAQEAVLCVRLDWLSYETPTRLIERREQCPGKKLEDGEGETLRLVFTLTSKRRVTGDTLIASIHYAGGQFIDPLNERTAGLPQ